MNKFLVIVVMILISCLTIGLVSAQDIGENETVISVDDNSIDDYLEEDTNEAILDVSDENEILEGMTIGSIGPPTVGNNLTSLQNIVKKGGVVMLRNNFSYQEGDPVDGITIKRNIVLVGDNITIDGGNIARLFVISNGSTVCISGINFVNATTNSNGAALFFNGTSGFVNNCSFVNCHAAKGGAVYFDGISLAINNTIFKDNSAESEGGAIHIQANSTAVLNSKFIANNADNGGSIYWKKTYKKSHVQNADESSSDLGTSAMGNYPIAIGTKCIAFGNNTIVMGSYSKAINCDESIVLGVNNNISDSFGVTVLGYDLNITNMSGISVLYGHIFKDGELGIVNSLFDSNTANQAGGAIYMDSNSLIKTYNSQFNRNTAKNGGAIRSLNIEVNKTDFNENRANYRGGAILPYGEANIYDSTFYKNTAHFQGGAVYSGLTKKVTKVYNSIFDANGVTGYGGGNYYGGALFDADLIESCRFTNNYAWSGGAIYQWHDHNYYRLSINNSVFENNSAWGTGGAVYAHYGGNIYYSNFTNNIAGDVGGAIGGWNQIPYKCVFINNTAKKGGAVGGESARAYNNLFVNNSATDSGGAIWGFNLIVKDNLIINSSSKNNGGAIATNEYFATTSTFTNNTIVNANSSKGGAVYFENHALVKSVFTLNRIINAKAGIGGAIYTNSITILKDNYFEKTFAKTGGVIFNVLNLTVENNTIVDSAAELGRDIYNEKDIAISYLTFIDGKTIFAEYGDSLLIYANLTDDMGNTITGQNISFTIGDATYSGEAVEGKTSFNYIVDFKSGQKSVNGYYDGSEIKNTVVKSGLIKVNPATLSIVKSINNLRYYIGDRVVFTVTVKNTGKVKALNVVVLDNIPSGLKLLGTNSNKGSLKDSEWIIDELDGGESAVITYTCELTAEGLITNEAIASSDNSESVKSKASINVLAYQPEISVEKVALTSTVMVGNQANFEIIVKNTGRVAIKGITVTEDSFDGLIYDGYHESRLWKHSIVNTKNVWTLTSDLAPNEVVSLFVNFNTSTIGTFTNTVIVSGINLNKKSASASVTALYPHLNAKKVSLMPITHVGNQTMFEITVFNNGEFDVHNLYVIEDSFEGLTFSDYLHDDLWSHSIVNGKHKWTFVEEFAVGETIGLFVVFNTTDVGEFTNFAVIGSDETIDTTVNATVLVNETVHPVEGANPQLDVKITPVHSLIILGNQIMFEIIVTNSGDAILHNTTVLEHAFDDLIFDHFIDHTGLWNHDPVQLFNSPDLLRASDDELKWVMNTPLYTNETIGFFVVFNSTKSGVFTNTIRANSDKTPDKFADASVEVVVPEYTIEKVALNKTVTIDEKVYFEIIVKNTGCVNITELTIAEKPEQGLTYDSYMDSEGFWIESEEYTWQLNTTLLSNETVSFFVVYKAEKVGNLTNTIFSESKTANATVEVIDKSNATNRNSTSDDSNSTDEDDIEGINNDSSDENSSVTPDKNPTQSKIEGSLYLEKSEIEENDDSNKSVSNNSKVGLKAVGNPLILLLVGILGLGILTRKRK